MVTASRSDRPQSENAPPDAPAGAPEAGANPFEPVLQKLSELLEYAAEYLAVRQDKAKVALRRVVIKVVLGVFAVLAGLTTLMVALVLLLVGLAGWIGDLLGSQPVGGIVLGGGICFVTVAGLVAGLIFWGSSSRRKTFAKYERRHARQRARFNNDVIGRAARRQKPV